MPSKRKQDTYISESESEAEEEPSSPKEEASRRLNWNTYLFFCNERRPDLVKSGVEAKAITKELSKLWDAVSEEDKAKYGQKLASMKKEIKEKYPDLKEKEKPKRPVEYDENGKVKKAPKKKREGPGIINIDMGLPPKVPPPLFAFKPEKSEGVPLTGDEKLKLYNALPEKEREVYIKQSKEYEAKRAEIIEQYRQEDEQYLKAVLVQ